MLRSRNLIFVFIPAILIAGFTLFVRIIQYQPLYPKVNNYQEENANGTFSIPIYPEDPIIGSKKANKTIIAFEDFACEGCKIQFTLLDQLLSTYPNNVKIIWKGLPVSQFPNPSKIVHQYAFCVNQQNKFTEFQKLAFTNSDNLSTEILDIIINQIDIKQDNFRECLESEESVNYIEKTEQLGMLLNIQAVPTFFIDSKQITTPNSLEGWKTLLKL